MMNDSDDGHGRQHQGRGRSTAVQHNVSVPSSHTHTYLAGLRPLLENQHVGVERVGGDAPRVCPPGARRSARPARLRPDTAGSNALGAGLLLLQGKEWWDECERCGRRRAFDILCVCVCTYIPVRGTWAPVDSAAGRGSGRRPSGSPQTRSHRLFTRDGEERSCDGMPEPPCCRHHRTIGCRGCCRRRRGIISTRTVEPVAVAQVVPHADAAGPVAVKRADQILRQRPLHVVETLGRFGD